MVCRLTGYRPRGVVPLAVVPANVVPVTGNRTTVLSRDATGGYARWEARACRRAVRPLDLLMSCKFSEAERLQTRQLLSSRHRQRETIRSLFDVPASHAPRHNPTHRLYISPSVATSADRRNTSTHDGLPGTTLSHTQTL